MEGVIYINGFVDGAGVLFDLLKESIIWDTRMVMRKTASYGVAYNYSQMSFPYQPMPEPLLKICADINATIGFEPNNCLINYYPDGKSKMGYHSDQIDILEKDTGVAIVSLGETRLLKFRNIEDKSQSIDFELITGSLLYMTQDVQKQWEHTIPKSDVNNSRMSLIFRRIMSI